MTALIN